jgi:hypothetical protein
MIFDSHQLTEVQDYLQLLYISGKEMFVRKSGLEDLKIQLFIPEFCT